MLGLENGLYEAHKNITLDEQITVSVLVENGNYLIQKSTSNGTVWAESEFTTNREFRLYFQARTGVSIEELQKVA